jgi:membrane protease YdiL (CAAX protease family)
MIAKIKILLSSWNVGRCHHRESYSQNLAFLYCLSLAAAYVGALYILVPRKVRKLDRDHPRHIQFRSFASLVVSLGAVATYPLLFCQDEDDSATFSISELVFGRKFVLGVLMHTITLYFGSIVSGLLKVSDIRKAALARGQKPKSSYPQEVFSRLLRPTLLSFVAPLTPEERWKTLRNLVVAPWTEEVVFRGCMVPALLGAGMSPVRVAFVSPLCFGVAHFHHAMARLSKGENLHTVLIVTSFQFVYTSLFGSYSAYAFIRTGSVTAVTMSHAYCNWMGLPDFNFVQPNHPMYQHRMLVFASFIAGVFGFKWGFSSGLLLPLPAQLPAYVSGTIE